MSSSRPRGARSAQATHVAIRNHARGRPGTYAIYKTFQNPYVAVASRPRSGRAAKAPQGPAEIVLRWGTMDSDIGTSSKSMDIVDPRITAAGGRCDGRPTVPPRRFTSLQVDGSGPPEIAVA